MNIKSLFDQFVGSGSTGDLNDVIGKLAKNTGGKSSGLGIPGGVAGGLAAGGLVTLLMSNKKARKYAGKAAKVGGAALLGGAAYTLYKNWQQQQAAPTTTQPLPNTLQTQPDSHYQTTLIKAMIAAAKADGHIDNQEQAKIFEAVESLGLPSAEKGMIFDLLSQPISVMDIAQGIVNDEQKAEVYLASCIVGEIDHPAERKHLDDLALVMNLPQDLKANIEAQAAQGILE